MRVFAIFFTLILTAAAAADDPSGEYRLSMPEVGSALLLRPTGEFEYFFIYGAADYAAKGSWRAESGSVILTTAGKDEPLFTLRKSAPGPGGEIRVHVQARNGKPVGRIDVRVVTGTDTLDARTDEDGVAVLAAKSAIKSLALHVPVYDVEAGPFNVTDGATEFWFEINGDAITQVKFRDERLKVVSGGLEMTYWKTDKPLLYRKARR